jgi:hypothetical protein
VKVTDCEMSSRQCEMAAVRVDLHILPDIEGAKRDKIIQ